jgi:WD repeat-containing protein 48
LTHIFSVDSDYEDSYYLDRLKPHKNSVYTMAMNASGTLLSTGCTDKFVRVFDLRTKQKSMKLRGHQDNIRSLLMNQAGTRVRFTIN